MTWQDRSLSSAALLGFVTNFKDGAVWGLLPLVLVARGFGLPQVAAIASTYTLVWALAQALFGPLSDRWGRRTLAAGGVLLQALSLWGLSQTSVFGPAMVFAVLLGTGTGMAYPTLMVWVADVSGPDWQATALGVYRFWRDAGYAVGALGTGFLASHLGASGAMAWSAGGVALFALIAWLRSDRGPAIKLA